jgi:hypothetical protein
MRLTLRDQNLFRHLSDYGMLTTKQINAMVFNGIATTTVLRRLRILEQQNLIKRMLGLNSGEPLWIITDKALEYFSGGDYYKRYWNKNLLEHDFKLLCLRLHLERSGVAKSWEPEHKIRYLIFQKFRLEEAKKKLIPDGIMIIEQNEKKQAVAIELELTLKNKERLKEVLKRYLDKKELHMLWYVCGNKMVANAIQNVWKTIKCSSHLILKVTLYDEVMKKQSAHSPAQGVSKNRSPFPLPPPTPYTTDHPLSTNKEMVVSSYGRAVAENQQNIGETRI